MDNGSLPPLYFCFFVDTAVRDPMDALGLGLIDQPDGFGTALGQREDGALLLLVLDGRSINTLGATMEDVVNIMLEYGAINAGNLDGGSSSVMVYGGEIINHCASVTGPRRIPTGFIVLKEGAQYE